MNGNIPYLGKIRQIIATASLGCISFGASCGWTSPVLPYFENANSDAPFHLSVEEVSWVESTLAIGALLAAIPAGYIVQYFGRKKTILALVVPVLIFTTLVLCASNTFVLCIARFCSGIAGGGVSVVGAMYISEIADVSLRGTLGSLFEMLIFVGLAFVNVAGAYIHYSWLTLMIGIQAVIFGLIFCFIPESPVHLMKLGKREEAEKAIKFFRDSNADVAKEITDILIGFDQTNNVPNKRFLDLFNDKSTIKGLIACVGLTIFQQLSAVDGIIFNLVDILQKADGIVDGYTSSVIVTWFQFIFTVLFVFAVEKFRRKTLLYVSAIGVSLSLFALAIYFQLKSNGIHLPIMDVVPLISIIVYFFAFAFGMGPIPWLINGELFPTDVKGPANGITIASNWTFLFVVTKTFPIMMDKWAYYTFYFFAACMVVCVAFIKYCVPETKGKTLQEIQEQLKS